ncbi:hypothetical protein [Candidatus Frankia alpina]|uniref:hypothetical protein n=1 Tax=Candidatus Frankia alpina TaxID=2699483 RepID=UPI0039A2CA64
MLAGQVGPGGRAEHQVDADRAADRDGPAAPVGEPLERDGDAVAPAGVADELDGVRGPRHARLRDDEREQPCHEQ